jgi:hypothetical protein
MKSSHNKKLLMKRLPYLLILSLVFCTNSPKGGIDWSYLVQKYSGDTLRLKAVYHLKANMVDLVSYKVTYYNDTSGNIALRFEDFSNDSILRAYLREHHIKQKTVITRDLRFVTTAQIESAIDTTFFYWGKYPWNKNFPTGLSYEFLLPYKILEEDPAVNNSVFREKYRNIIDSLSHIPHITSHTVYKRLIDGDVVKWFRYGFTDRLFSKTPSLNELLLVKEGGCLEFAYLYTYLLKSVGIPATVDFVPHWGSCNGGHAEVAFMDSTGKMTTYENGRLQKASKVFRMNFTRQYTWSDSIKPLTNDIPFNISWLKNDHWQDVTSLHTLTSDISCQLPDSMMAPFGYICVYDNGRWEPIYWGKVNPHHEITFKNMGRNIIYRVAIPKKQGGQQLWGNVLMVDSAGLQREISPDETDPIDISLSKSNCNSMSQGKKKESYGLYFLNNEQKWQLKETKNCSNGAGITFERVPKHTIYKLVSKNDNVHIVRPFLYEGGKPIWL